MRVIAGSARGRRLKTVPSTAVRPTADRVKEAIFSMVGSRADLADLTVLDLYAGSGALGIESLSRGAQRCTFVERDARALAVLRQNVRQCGFEQRAEIVARSVAAASTQLARAGRSFDLVLMDPPYADTAAQQTLEELDRLGLVRPAGLVVFEHEADRVFGDIGRLRLTRSKRYGKTGVTLLAQVVDEEISPL